MMKNKKKKIKKENNKKFSKIKKDFTNLCAPNKKEIEDHFMASYKVEKIQKTNPFDFIFNKSIGKLLK